MKKGGVQLESNISSRKLILALLYVPGKSKDKEPVEGITRMEKMIFLLTSDHFRDIFSELNYKPDNFGPFSDKLADQIENLVDLKLISRSKGKNPELADEFNYYYTETKIPDKFELTMYGEALAKEIFAQLTDEERNKIIHVKEKFNTIPLDALLSFLYNTISEEWLEHSKIKDKYVKSY